MRHEIERTEPERDPALAAALREAYEDAELSPDRAAALRARIRNQASSPAAVQDGTTAPGAATGTGTADAGESVAPVIVARPRRSFPFGGRPASHVARRYTWLAPALLAATVAAVLLLRPGSPKPGSTGTPPALRAVGYATAEQALTSDVSDAEFARTLAGGADPAALLSIAVGAASPGTPQ